jgi:hypothetical protein
MLANASSVCPRIITAARQPASIAVEVFAERADQTRVYHGKVNTGSLIAEIAALVGDPARGTMLTALLDGRESRAEGR